MRYIEVEYKPGGKRYTYHHDGPEELAPEVDWVEIVTLNGPDQFRILAVHASRDHLPPKQKTKAIGKVLARQAAPAP